MRYIYHIDVNSAFLAWTAVYRIRELNQTEDLREIPSIIGGDEESRRGIVLAKSTPAKKYGIETAEPVAAARRKCPGLVVVPSDFSVYKRYSKDFMDIIRSYATEVYQYSIDEAWAVFDDCEEIYGDMVEFAYRLKDEIKDRLGFTVNIGVSDQYKLAKIAGDFEKPDKVHTLFSYEVTEKLWPLPVNVLLYVGKSMTKSLKNLGIITVKDLYDADREVISRNLGKFGISLWDNVHGEDINPAGYHDSDQKGYGNSTTTATDTEDWDTARDVLMGLSGQVGERMRRDGVYATCVSVSVRYPDFDHISRQMMISNPTNSTTQIYEYACELLGNIWDGHKPIRQLGVRVTKVTDEKYEQLGLFDNMENSEKLEKMERADAAMDSLRSRLGKDVVKRGIQL